MPNDEIDLKDAPEFSELDLEIIEEILEEEKVEKEVKKTAKPLINTKKASDTSCALFVDSILTKYPKHFSEQKHYSLTILQIIHKSGYRPHRSLVSNTAKYDPDTAGDIQIVQKHLSEAVLNDLSEHVDKWAAENPAVEEQVEINSDQETLSYNTHNVEVEDSASSEQEGWASW